jgi:hypothetical protein
MLKDLLIVEEQSLNTCDFAYRSNADGTIDSICLACFRTAGSARHAINLKELEGKHSCLRPIYGGRPHSPYFQEKGT